MRERRHPRVTAATAIPAHASVTTDVLPIHPKKKFSRANFLDADLKRARANSKLCFPVRETSSAFEGLPPADPSRWFAEHVQPHEAALRAFLRGRFPGLADIDDLIQETYARLLRANIAGRVGHVRPYLFATARNAAIDQLRHQQTAATDSLGNIEQLPVIEERPHAADAMSLEQEIAILHEAIAALPPRCREILRLRRFEGLSHGEIGMRLGISANTVDAQLCLAVLRCRQYLLLRGVARERLASFPSAPRP